jgi:PadR family transcriptional regulator PadR
MTDKTMTSDLLRGHTDTIILKLLVSGDKYGYEITKLVHELSGRLYELKEATMYSSLKRLENDAHITS